MRKSAAPSRNHSSTPISMPSVEELNSSEKKKSGVVRSKQNILSLLSTSLDSDDDFSFSDPFSLKESKSVQNDPPPQKLSEEPERIYEVVYGKPSTKKHKTWDGDGLLVVNTQNNTATLKDSNDKILGQMSKFKTDMIKNGNFLNIGGKVVDIVSLLNPPIQSNVSVPKKENTPKRSAGNIHNIGPPNKLCKLQQRPSCQANTKNTAFGSSSSSKKVSFLGPTALRTTGSNVRTTDKILSLLSGPTFGDDDLSDDSENLNLANIDVSKSSQSQECSKRTANNLRIYEVVYGKPSTKKHKTWDGDGTLVICLNEKLATLKDENGKILGTKSNFKMEMVEEEEYLSIGGKIVDILSLVNGEPPQKTTVTQDAQCQSTYPKINFTTKKKFRPPGVSDYSQVVKKEEPQNSDIFEDAPKCSLFTTFKASCAPTPPSKNEHTNFSSGSVQPSKNGVNGTRSTKDILALLSAPATSQDIDDHLSFDLQSRRMPDIESSTSSESVGIKVSSQLSNNIRKFNVMIAKKSTKKQKSWEDDGILEVNEDNFVGVLKKMNGTVIGQSKIDTMEKGSQFVIGSKEVEILNEVNETMKSVKETKASVEISSSARQPKPAADSKKRCVPLFSRGKSAIYMQNIKPLILPKPNYEHQWKFNQKHKPVVDVSVEPFLLRVLRQHQLEGVSFLYSCVVGIRDPKFLGAILADEMGLGKTLQSITLIWTLLHQSPYQGEVLCKRVLIVTPSSLTKNWKNEFVRWLGSHRINIFVVDQKNKARDYCKLPMNRNPILIISYEMYVKSVEDLSQIKFDLLICDEGHRLKNTNIKVATCLNQLDCPRRILLTGTPIQNDLQEFYALVNFVNPGILGTPSEFRKSYADPITMSRQPNIDEDVQEFGEERASHLNKLTGDFILRRTQDVNDKYLPNKNEAIVFCSSTSLQQELYEATVAYWEDRNFSTPGTDSGVKHLSVITALKKICNHPSLLKQSDADDFYAQEESLKNFLNNMLPKIDADSSVSLAHHSSKFFLVDCLLKELQSTSRERIVLISYFTQTLDLLATLCDENQYKYLRLDGSTPAAQRIPIVDRFNSDTNNFVFLLSAKAGGVGLNLVGASRLVLFDSDWNPATDLQAMSRIWRDGQKKSVFIYRLFSTGTIEEKILQRQISKTGISSAVVDPKNTSHVRLSIEELKDLFRYEPDIASSTHDMLGCTCDGTGSVPNVQPTEDEEDEVLDLDDRDCQVTLDEDSCTRSNVLRMNQLMQWDHHGKPLDADFLQTLRLSSAEKYITYIFHNKTTTEVGSQS